MASSSSLNSDNNSKPIQVYHWVALLGLAFVWGSSFILISRGLRDGEGADLYPWWILGLLRLFLASIALAPIAIKNFNKYRKYFPFLLIVGLCGNGIPAFLFAWAQTGMDSAYAGMLNSAVPIFTLIIGLVVFKIAVKRNQILGLVIGTIGAVGLISQKVEASADSLGFHPGFASLVIIATVCYAISVNTMRHKLTEVPSLTITSIALLIAGLPCGIILFAATDFVEILSTNPAGLSGLGFISILAIVGTALALVLFNKLVKETSAIFATSVTYIIPVFALMWGIIFHESVTWIHAIFGAVILSGVYLISKK